MAQIDNDFRVAKRAREARNDVDSIAELARQAQEGAQMWFVIDDALRAIGYMLVMGQGEYYVSRLIPASNEYAKFYSITDAIRYALKLLTQASGASPVSE
jgi:hypothetical protein